MLHLMTLKMVIFRIIALFREKLDFPLCFMLGFITLILKGLPGIRGSCLKNCRQSALILKKERC